MALTSITLSCTATSVPKVVKLPSRSITTTGTVVPKLLRVPQKRLMAVATSGIVISLIMMGADAFDVLEGKRLWIVNGVDRFKLNTKKRFTFLVRGKPYG